jgi:hypothetical protein
LRAKAATAASRGKDAETGEGEGAVPSAVEREPVPRSEPPIVQCVQCGKTEGPFSKCAGCHQTRYCSAGVYMCVCVRERERVTPRVVPACQRAHWPAHKAACKAARKAAKKAAVAAPASTS